MSRLHDVLKPGDVEIVSGVDARDSWALSLTVDKSDISLSLSFVACDFDTLWSPSFVVWCCTPSTSNSEFRVKTDLCPLAVCAVTASTASAMSILVKFGLSGEDANPTSSDLEVLLICCTRRTAFLNRLKPPPRFFRLLPVSFKENADNDLLCKLIDEFGDDFSAGDCTFPIDRSDAIFCP